MHAVTRLSVTLALLGAAGIVALPAEAYPGPYRTPTPAPTVQVMGAWTVPVSEDLVEGWDAAPGFGVGLKWSAGPRMRIGFEVSYLRQELDKASWGGSEFQVSGADIDIVPITMEAEILLAPRRSPVMPTFNLGAGLYHISIDDQGFLGPGGRYAVVDYDDANEFGLHIGGGLEFRGRRAGLRIDGSYHLVFREGDDMSFMPVRVGFFIDTGR